MMSRITLVAGLCAGIVAVGAQGSNTKALIGAYLQIHELLAEDKIEGIKAPAQQIGQHAGAMGEQGAAIATAAKAVEGASDLKTAREAFGKLSDAVVTATKGHDIGDVKLAFCPMAQRSWLQKDSKIRNPYYGSAMLDCGELRERK